MGPGNFRTQRRNSGANLARSQFQTGFVDHRHMLPRDYRTNSNVVMALLRIVFCPEPPETK
jgi:hypothetical protein